MHWKPMDPEVIQQMIKEHEDILTPLVKAEEEVYKNTKCPVCFQGGCSKKVRPPKVVMTADGPTVARSPFGDGPLPEGNAFCIHCSTEFDPKSGIIYKTDASVIPSSRSDPLQAEQRNTQYDLFQNKEQR
jgi:hypothetical protein